MQVMRSVAAARAKHGGCCFGEDAKASAGIIFHAKEKRSFPVSHAFCKGEDAKRQASRNPRREGSSEWTQVRAARQQYS